MLLSAPVAILGDKLDTSAIIPYLGEITIETKNVRVNSQALFLWLPKSVTEDIFALAGISQMTLNDWAYYTDRKPKFHVVVLDELRSLINEHCIYNSVDSNNYFIELMDDGRLFVGYNLIIGSRYIGRLTEGAIAYLKTTCASRLMEVQAKYAPHTINAAEQTPVVVDSAIMEELNLLRVDGQNVVLPQVHLMHYQAIKQMMQNAGGRYSKNCFSFPAGINPEEVMQSLLGGKKVNVQQETQSFFTPLALGCQVIGAVGDVEGKRMLEPSAGNAALADIAKQAGAAEVVVIENHPVNINQLVEKGYDVIERDFLTVSPEEIGLFDAIVANPPFSRNQDIDHVNHMWKFLKPGGVLSTITSTSWFNGSQKKQREFAEFLKENDARIEHIDAGAFKASGTTVPTIHVVVQKRKMQMQEQLFA